ncbi:NAD(P)-dependent oxidoreductase [Cryobacterium arcticum]|uniref:NAD(P)-dependent oxidoreductase n=1 Tax=Cryobacterium arcticum TaxID=670052 RepID=A0A317ZQP4_9MICO|nr:NAD(P)-dependent oxidoreductase [Cryobacterium arcticum]PXA67084.1 NAD(P)-dependent oxidoreductase [Cryobacterium arcticum]
MLESTELLHVGWVGLGDQGAPIARAIAEAGYPLHVWARRPQSLSALEGVPYTVHETPAEMAALSDIVGLCLSEDKDNKQIMVEGGLLAAMRPGSTLVNHGTGLPAFAVEMTELAATRDIHVVDAPVSGGRAGAVAKRLTTIVGGEATTVEKVRPIFESFSAKVAHMGAAGAGQVGKLVNNAMLMANQKNIDDLLSIAAELGVDIPQLVDVIRSGTGSSRALEVIGTAVTPANAEHLSRLQLIDMDLFDEAVAGLGRSARIISRRAVEGAEALPSLAAIVTPLDPE